MGRIDISEFEHGLAALRGRRAIAAFALGAAISGAALVEFQGDLASAHGPTQQFLNWMAGGSNDGFAERRELVRDVPVASKSRSNDGFAERREPPVSFPSGAEAFHAGQRQVKLRAVGAVHAQAHSGTSQVAALVTSFGSLPTRTVCVRLCDGYFFPVAPVVGPGDYAGHASTCSNVCPDAPTELFVQPAGSDRIEDAVSLTGAKYSALPVALRNRSTQDNTCTCHREAAMHYSLKRDFTLRKGDGVMTGRGIVVFQGGTQGPFGSHDFVALDKSSLPSDQRSQLRALEAGAGPTKTAIKTTWFPLAAAPAIQLTSKSSGVVAASRIIDIK